MTTRLSVLALLLIVDIGIIKAQTFTEVSRQSGIDHISHTITLIGGGCAFFDYDNDGWLDIYISGGNQSDKLYRNNGDGTFSERTAQAGFGTTANFYTMGVVTGDIDNDGFRDVFVTTLGIGHSFHNLVPNMLFRNNGNGSFTDISQQAGITERSWSVSAAMGDFNLDGYLDIYVVNYVDSLGFIEDSITNDPIGYSHTGHYNFLYLNNGNNTFTNAGVQMQVNDKGTGLAVSFTDYDNDSDMDIYVVNDFGAWVTPNRLYQNNFPANSFTDVSSSSGADAAIYGMGVAIGDYDEDGDLDYYCTNIGENILLNNNGNGTFADSAVTAGVQNGHFDSLLTTAWGCAFFDYDNDTWLDLFVADGYVPALDIIETSEPDPNKLYKNNMDGTFTDVSALAGIDDSTKSRGMAAGDYDNDGDLDLIVVVVAEDTGLANGAHTLLFRNDIANGNHWLKVKLQGTQNNRDGIGSRVKVYNNGRMWMREIDGGSSHASQNSTIAHFGLGSDTMVDSVVVIWPGGNITSFANVSADQSVNIIETGSMQVTGNRHIELCDGDSIYVAGAWQKSNGLYYDTILSSPVDTIVITHLTVYPDKVISLQVSICEGDSAMVGGSYHSADSTFFDTLLTLNGCDSVIITELTVTPLQVAIADAILCEGDSIFAGGAWQTESGDYYDTLPSSMCDTVVITSVGVLPSITPDTVHAMICSGDSVFAGGKWQKSSGIFTDTFETPFGCDSIVFTEVKLIPEALSTEQINLCEGDSLFAQGEWQTTSGTYYDSLISAAGCDSIHASLLDVLQEYFYSDSIYIMAGDSIQLGGAWQNVQGIYTDSFVTSSGCDSIVTTTLFILTGIETLNENSTYIFVHPNPSYSGFTISYSTPADGVVEIKMLSSAGKVIATLLNEKVNAGKHELDYRNSGLTAGVYLLSLKTGKDFRMAKVVVY